MSRAGSRPGRVVRATALVAGTGAAAGAAGLAAMALWTVLGTRSRRFTADSVPVTDVGMVLGAETYPDRTPAPALRARLDLGARLYHAGKVRTLLVSGDERSHHQATVMADHLIARGVPPEDLLRDPLGVDTYASCARAQREYGVRRLTVVSQDYHLPRALTICRLIGLEAYGVGDTSVRQTVPQAWWRSVRREVVANIKMVADLLRHHVGASASR